MAPLVVGSGRRRGGEGVAKIPVLYYESYDVLATLLLPPSQALPRWPDVYNSALLLGVQLYPIKGSLPPQL